MRAERGQTLQLGEYKTKFRGSGTFDRGIQIVRDQRNQPMMLNQQEKTLPIELPCGLHLDPLAVFRPERPAGTGQQQIKLRGQVSLPLRGCLRGMIRSILQVSSLSDGHAQ